MRALVSGASGFVGRHFAARLDRDGWDVEGFDIADYISRDAVEVFDHSSARYDLLVHAAANVGGRVNIDGDPLGVARNAAIDAAMFRWAVRTGTRVLYFSSSAAYPTWMQARGKECQLIEGDIDQPDVRSYTNPRNGETMVAGFASEADNTYGTVKRFGEYLAGKARDLGADVHVVRPFSGYGEDQSLDYPFPSFIDRAKRRADPFDVWGDGTQVRDFIHIDDIVEACLRIVDADCQQPVNLCTGIGTSFLELADKVCAAVGYSPEVLVHPARPTGVHHRVGDPTRMHDFWEPRITLDEGIARAVAA